MGMQNFPGCHKGQGATEYLVLLAVVLIVALVSVALLGFFPGMASDAQMTQSKMYWSSASPIAIVESAARYWSIYPNANIPYLRIRNVGAYPIRITKLIGSDNHYASTVYVGGSSYPNISSIGYLGPGEEMYFSQESLYGTVLRRHVGFEMVGTCSGDGGLSICGLTSNCQNGSSFGTIFMPVFGFEYIQYVENQQITKRQIGAKPLIIKCREPY